MLEQLNYRTIAVESAKAALDFLAAGKPVDLVFSDVMLPGDPRWPGTGAHYRQAISTHSGIAHERLRESTQRPARDADLTKAL
ncbi:MAG: hypothetical protein WA665_08135, partial [Pseudolabrys sp.]